MNPTIRSLPWLPALVDRLRWWGVRAPAAAATASDREAADAAHLRRTIERELLRLDAHTLRDIGAPHDVIARADAAREIESAAVRRVLGS